MVQVELPIVPNVGDRLIENMNTENTNLSVLIREGIFIEACDRYGKTLWKVQCKGKTVNFDPEFTKIVENAVVTDAIAPVLVEEVAPVLVEVVAKEILLPFDHEIPDKEKGDENYTPEYFLEACRAFLGWFDLDPFSNAIAQKSVRAKTFWTKDDNALTKDWTPYLKKIVNPPYSQGLIGKCIDKILGFCTIGETILIVNSSTSAKWFQRCKNACSAYLNPSKRLPFYNPYREIQYLNGTKKRSGNEYDQTVFYFGDRPLEFAKAMEHLGSCSIPIKKSSCLPTSTTSEALEPLALQPETLEKSQALPISTSAQTRKKSTRTTSKKSQSTEISAITIPPKELICLREASLAQEPVKQEAKLDLTTGILPYGLNTSDAFNKVNQDLQSLKTPQGYSIAEWEQSYKGFPKAGTMRNGRLSALDSLEVPKLGKECLSLPTLTSSLATEKSRASGQSKCEKWLKDNGFLQNTQVLSAEMMALLFGFPKDWTLCLQDAIAEPLGELNLGTFLGEQSILTVQPLSSKESCSSTDNLSVSPRTSLDELQSKAEFLIQSGASPKGIWLEKSKPHGKDFIQVVWKADHPRPEWGGRKSKYVGKLDSDEHLSAMSQFDAGKRLKEINKQIKELTK
jgi:hypothetical protein